MVPCVFECKAEPLRVTGEEEIPSCSTLQLLIISGAIYLTGYRAHL